jgi:hypothetical protein
MTTNFTTPNSATSTTRRPTSAFRPDGWTAAGAVIGFGCTLVGQYWETSWKSGPGDWTFDFARNGGWGSLALMIAVVTTAMVLVSSATARARAVDPQRTARRALMLAAIGVLTLAVFWTGVPSVLAGGALGLVVDTRRRAAQLPARAAAAAGLAVLTVAAALWLAFTG